MRLLKHWTIYLVGAAVAWVVYTGFLFASGLAVRAILEALEIPFAPTPAGQLLATTVETAASLPFAATAAAVLIFSFSFLKWPIDNPAISARLETEQDA